MLYTVLGNDVLNLQTQGFRPQKCHHCPMPLPSRAGSCLFPVPTSPLPTPAAQKPPHLVVRGHQVLHCLSISSCDLLDVRSLLLQASKSQCQRVPEQGTPRAPGREETWLTWLVTLCPCVTMMCSCPRACCSRSGASTAWPDCRAAATPRELLWGLPGLRAVLAAFLSSPCPGLAPTRSWTLSKICSQVRS